jgi:pimeloyl-ACP methyl ester carboxylesterase
MLGQTSSCTTWFPLTNLPIRHQARTLLYSYTVDFTPCLVLDHELRYALGFPDSHTLWTRIITSERLENYTCIAVDLPGYGGSDNLPEYNAQNMLNAMSFFILEMRKKYLKAGGRVVMVTHDWGAVIGARLAAEAPELADRWILASALLVSLLLPNILTSPVANSMPSPSMSTPKPPTTSEPRNGKSPPSSANPSNSTPANH